MRPEARELQENAVAELIAQTATKKKEITFKAPTGSGKTHMMAEMMDRILGENKDVIFLVSSLSKGGLAKQNYDQFLTYQNAGAFQNLKPYMISSEIAGEERLFIPPEYNVYILPRDLYKKGGRLMQGAMEAFLHEMREFKVYGGREKKIYLIKDECHIATKNLDDLAMNFEKVYNFSATPKLSRGQTPDIEIKNSDAVDAKLIKEIELGENDGQNMPKDSVGDAINKFEEIKEQYRELIGVNPCLIIQISNKDKAEEEVANIMGELNKPEHTDLKWMTIVDDPKKCDTNDKIKGKVPVDKWKDYAKSNHALIDIIIFKMVISEGWDIPRACMLYQVRDSKSKQLDEQVIGRVRRNPRLLDFDSLSPEAQKLAMTAWIWGVVPPELQRVFAVAIKDNQKEITNEVRIKTTKLRTLADKEDFSIEKFVSEQPELATHKSVFELGKKIAKVEPSVRDLIFNYIDSYEKWWKVAENIDEIVKENNTFRNDYVQTMYITTDEDGNETDFSFPLSSYYTDNDNYANISDWVWRRIDGHDNFSFDSDAEREWAGILKDLAKDDNDDGDRAGKRIVQAQTNLLGEQQEKTKPVYLWGKNYVGNSEIKFEYYMGALHSSYPDFIMKDAYNRVHIFEVKSVNMSGSMPAGWSESVYKEKIAELKRAYKRASELTGQIFYLPIKQEADWQVFQYLGGKEKTLNCTQFEDFVKARA